jgi:Domain of unknown function (DUF1707)/Domain of unknown function (DUF4190)
MAASPGYGMMPADDGRLRASTADRERAVDVLKAGFAEGRLTKDEYDARVSQAYAARTYAELAMVTADLPGGQMVAAYSQPYMRPYRPARRRTNSLAVASLICGLAQPFLGLTTIPAIVLGHVARGQIRRTGEDGDGLATAGAVLGWIGLGIALLVILIVTAITAGHTHPGPSIGG